jgi:release factor glutamine methyltransferase
MIIKLALKTYNKIETELLLSFVLKKSKEFLYTHPETKLTPKQLKTFQTLANRRTKGEPIAYILGYKDFYGLRFKVTKDTLIPRPETEWIVDRAISLCHSRSHELKRGLSGIHNFWIPDQVRDDTIEVRNDNNIEILDLGTGSGCIAISIKKHLKNSNITGVDISSKALTVAKYNSKKHKTKISFIKSDLFSKLKSKKFDIIIANLPYVPIQDYQKLKDSLKYEPRSAITDNSNDFKVYEKFFKKVKNHLNAQAIILLEIDPKAEKFITTFTKQFLPNYKPLFYKDLHKLIRYVEIKAT